MFAEAVLSIRQDVVVGEVLNHSTVYDVFAEFAENRCKEYRPVVGGIRMTSLLEERHNVGFLPL